MNEECGHIWKVSPGSLLGGTGCPKCAIKRNGDNLRKSQSQYAEELHNINPNIIVIGDYKNSHTPITHECLLDGYRWDASPSNILSGHGCPKCANMTKMTHDEYVNKLSLINPNIDVVGEYINMHTPVTHHCLIHDVYWNQMPYVALKGGGCKECGKDKIKAKTMISNDEYIERLKNINPNIIAIEEYQGANTKILHECLIDGYQWYVAPGSIIQGTGCPRCANRVRRTQSDYIKELAIKNPTVEVVGKYIDARTKILHHCLTHDEYWYIQPYVALQGCGCEKCHRERQGLSRRKTTEQYRLEVKEINPDIEVVGNYETSSIPILHRCLLDGYEWNATPYSVLHGSGCPKCNESVGERRVRQWLEKHNIEYVYQYKFGDCKDIRCLPFDFYIPEYNLCIEFDGKHHFEPVYNEEDFITTILHDGMKNNYCKWNNIGLFRIPYFKNIENELNNFLLN